MSITNRIIERDHRIGGVFVKEVSPAAPGGPGTPLLMVHGAMHGWWAWEQWMPVLAASGWQCFALSLRNHTGSDSVPPDQYLRLTAADYVDDILAVIRSLPRPPVLIAHSMGSVLAQKAAEAAEVAGLVMICGAGPGQLGKLRDPIPLDRTVMRPAADIRKFFFRNIGDDALASYYARLVPESPGAINGCNDGTLLVDRARITCRALVIAGELDAVPLHPPQAIADFYDAQLLTVPGGSHNFMMEEASLPVAIRLNEWLLRYVDSPALPRPTPASGKQR